MPSILMHVTLNIMCQCHEGYFRFSLTCIYTSMHALISASRSTLPHSHKQQVGTNLVRLQTTMSSRRHYSDELPSSMHAHTAVFTDEEMGGESSNTANTKVNPNSLGSPRSHQNYDGNAGKWVDGRSSRLPWDDADREYYRPSPTPRHVPSTTNNFEIRALPERERRSDTICGMYVLYNGNRWTSCCDDR